MVLTGTVLFASATTLTLAVLVPDPRCTPFTKTLVRQNHLETFKRRRTTTVNHPERRAPATISKVPARGSKATENSGLDRYGLTIELWTSID